MRDEVELLVPVCSFCGQKPVVAWFEGPSFLRFVAAAHQVRSNEVRVACADCLRLVEMNDREGLVERGIARQRRRDAREGRTRDASEWPSLRVVARNQLDESFWTPRTVASDEAEE
jgi:hypothetical protein